MSDLSPADLLAARTDPRAFLALQQAILDALEADPEVLAWAAGTEDAIIDGQRAFVRTFGTKIADPGEFYREVKRNLLAAPPTPSPPPPEPEREPPTEEEIAAEFEALCAGRNRAADAAQEAAEQRREAPKLKRMQTMAGRTYRRPRERIDRAMIVAWLNSGENISLASRTAAIAYWLNRKTPAEVVRVLAAIDELPRPRDYLYREPWFEGGNTSPRELVKQRITRIRAQARLWAAEYCPNLIVRAINAHKGITTMGGRRSSQMTGNEPKGANMAIRLSDETDERLERLAAKLPATSKSGLARVLIERALDEVDDDPAKLVRPRVQPIGDPKEPK